MAKAPSAEDAARYIISVYIAHNLRAGHALRTGNFMSAFDQPGWQPGDFKPGMEYAIEQKWIEMSRPDHFVLTPAGFAEA